MLLIDDVCNAKGDEGLPEDSGSGELACMNRVQRPVSDLLCLSMLPAEQLQPALQAGCTAEQQAQLFWHQPCSQLCLPALQQLQDSRHSSWQRGVS